MRNAKAGAKPQKLADGGGLYLHITTAGAKVWRWRYTFGGTEQTLTIGHYPAIGLAEAREARDQARTTLKAGQNPVEARKAAQEAQQAADAITFEFVARAWYAQKNAGWSEKHAGQVIESLEQYVFPTLGEKPIRSITPKQVLDVLRVIEQRPAVETAHRVRQRMSAAFVFAIASDWADTDPAAIVKQALSPVIRRRQPALVELDAVREVLRRAEATPAHPGTRLALRLLALTALRPGELRGAVVGEFEDLDGEALWRVPGNRMKMKREHLVPLPPQAVETVLAARQLIGRGKLLFPSTRHAHRPMSENALGYLLNRAGYRGHHVPHGFRSAFSTIMNERYRADRAIIDLMLAHAPDNRVEAAYNRALHIGRRRELAAEWASILLEGMPPAAELLALARR